MQAEDRDRPLERKAQAVAARIEARTDSSPAVSARDRYLAEINATDSVLNATRRALIPVPTPVIDTFPPAVRAQRDSLGAELATLNRLIDRAENAPLPTSFRALAASPTVAADPRVRVLLDSLADVERERNAFGAVGAVDPVYLALTSRATAIGRGRGRHSPIRSSSNAARFAAPVIETSTSIMPAGG